MYEKSFRLTKLLTILTCFYGQIAPRTPEIEEATRKLVISRYIYFTQLCLTSTMLMLIFSFLINPKKSSIFKFLLPNVIIYELITMTIFWSLYFTNPELILGKIGMKKENYSLLNDLCQHLFPIFGLFVMFCETPMDHDNRRYLVNFSYAIVYAVMLRYNKKIKGHYPYGFMDVMSDIQVTFVFIPSLIAIFSIVLYGIIWLNIRSRKWSRIENK